MLARRLRQLAVDPANHPRNQSHLSAASGLVRIGTQLYVVADDEHHLASFSEAGDSVIELHRLAAGDLPADKKARKKLKPDLECMAAIGGGLLLLGSGSKPNRNRGFFVAVSAGGALQPAREVDLTSCYEALAGHLGQLNIEGAFASQDRFVLLQRANKGDARNASIEYPLSHWQDWLAGRRSAPSEIKSITSHSLGARDGIPLGFTDGEPLSDGSWLFSGVAEDTDNAYEDGACAASAIGRVDSNGELAWIELIEGAPKVEGIALDSAGRLLMVTDADDPAIASELLIASPTSLAAPAWR